MYFDYYDDESGLMSMIADQTERFESLLLEWVNEAGKRPLGYKSVDSNGKRTIIIYTRTPGVFIGLKGSLVQKYREKISEFYFGDNVEVKFEEIDGIVYHK